MTELKENNAVGECAGSKGGDAADSLNKMLKERASEAVLREARQETKRLNRKDVVPFLGTDAELVEAYEKHQEWQRVNQLDDARYVPEPFRKRQLRLTSAGELLDADVPPRETMLWPWFKVGDAAMIYAPAGLGKSFLTLTIAMAVAGGGAIKGLNWRVEKPASVLFVDGEMPTPDLRERMKTILDGGWIDGLDVEALRRNFSLFARLGQPDDDGFIDLANPEHHKIIGGHAAKAGVELVIFDNLSTLTESMEDENNSVQFRAINGFISKLKRRGISVIVVHHANKEGFAYRGSSAIAVIYDSIMQLGKLSADEDDGEATRFRLSFEKSRAKRTPETASRVVSMESFGYAIADGVERDENLASVVRIVKAGEHERLSKRNAEAAFGLNALTIWKKVVIGLDRGLVTADEVRATFNAPPVDVKAALHRADLRFTEGSLRASGAEDGDEPDF